MLARIFASYDHNQLRDLAVHHPFVELRHDFLDVGFYLVVRGDEHCEAVFLDRCEVFGWVDAALESEI